VVIFADEFGKERAAISQTQEPTQTGCVYWAYSCSPILVETLKAVYVAKADKDSGCYFKRV
jgi:hypothetical protein